MTARRLHAILKRHEIDPKFWPEFRAMVELGQTDRQRAWTRMNRVANYRAARSEIAAGCPRRRNTSFRPTTTKCLPATTSTCRPSTNR